MVQTRLPRILAAAALFVGLFGCSSSSTPNNNGSCQAYQVPAGTDLTQPQVSLKTDVVPIFQQSCSLSDSCHGAPSGGSGHLYLGPKTPPTDTAALLQSLKGATLEEPSLVYIKPGDPSNSYLMHKMDGDQCLYDNHCTTDPMIGPNCADAGQVMPQGSGALDVKTRDKVRRWIAQGAQNN